MRNRRFLGLLVALLAGCGAEAVQMAGGSSEQGNALSAVRIVIVDRDGHPDSARIELLPAQWLPGQDSSYAHASAFVPAGGTWISDSLKSQEYRILAEGRSGKRIAILSGIPGATDTIRLVPSLRLEGQHTASGSVRIPGTQLVATCSPTGHFQFDSLPVGASGLRFQDTATLVIDSLFPATNSYLTPTSGLATKRVATFDSIFLQPPRIYPAPGTYQAQVAITPWHPLSEAIFERAASADGPWTSIGTYFDLNATSTFWLRARIPGRHVSKPLSFTYTIVPADSNSSALPLVATAPTGLLNSFLPDSVRKTGDTLHLYALLNGCNSLPSQGIRGHLRSDTLDVFRLICPETTSTQIHMKLPGSSSIRWVYTLQPKGMLYPVP